MSFRFQLPGTLNPSTRQSPTVPLLLGGATLAIILIVVYVVPRLQSTGAVPEASRVVDAPRPVPVTASETPAVIREELNHHLELSQREIVRSIDDVRRAEREWALVTARLDPTYMPDSRRRASVGVEAAREAREKLQHALEQMQIVVDHLK
jgi:hypothetical protein